jgi:putative ubiquitin-RnfH superfamily antitoxin RatB of RatAB toxin-antitoxin module
MAEQPPSTFTVEVAYALPEKQALLSVKVSEGVTALQAVQQSGIGQQFSELALDSPALELGVFGQVVPHDYPLQPGDRVEIYRPLKADPKEARKARAAKARADR